MINKEIYQEIETTIEGLKVERDAKDAEPVGKVESMPGADRFTMAVFEASLVPTGTELYTTPPSTAQIEAAAIRKAAEKMDELAEAGYTPDWQFAKTTILALIPTEAAQVGQHRPLQAAGPEDQAVYQAIADNYFNASQQAATPNQEALIKAALDAAATAAWVGLADYCKARRINPHHQAGMFEICDAVRQINPATILEKMK